MQTDRITAIPMVESSVNPTPRVSVVMPVRNAGRFLSESIESILRQTLNDFEFVLLDDASEDGSREALQDWAARDHRIRLFRSETPLGLAGSSQFVVEHSRAPSRRLSKTSDGVLGGGSDGCVDTPSGTKAPRSRVRHRRGATMLITESPGRTGAFESRVDSYSSGH